VILPYSLRLVCLCFASFFLVHLVLGLAASFLGRIAIRIAERREARSAARILLALRLLPVGLACFLAIGLCAPSYLWLEPRAAAERVRWEILAAAVLGVTVWILSTVRALRAIGVCRSFGQYCRTVGRPTFVSGEPMPVWVLQGSAPVVALAGIVRPQLVISSGVMAELSAQELGAALRHERAHRTSRDNLKRLVMLFAPDVLPWVHTAQVLERSWARSTEWAADDAAVDGDSCSSLSLAAALVRVARMGSVRQVPMLATSLLADGQDLQARVHRLLGDRPSRDKNEYAGIVLVAGCAALTLTVLMLQPATLHFFHMLVERLIQ
jgi:Zn-dependent protease with chaperone function